MSQLHEIKHRWETLCEADAHYRTDDRERAFTAYLDALEPEPSDPLDEAIVKAAITFVDGSMHPGDSLRLRGAVQAKLDAEKPKTAEEVAERAFDLSLPVIAAPIAIVQALRDEGLLKE